MNDDDHCLEEDDDNQFLQGEAAPGTTLRQRHTLDNRLNPDYTAPTISGADSYNGEGPPPPKRKTRKRLKPGALVALVTLLAALGYGLLTWRGHGVRAVVGGAGVDVLHGIATEAPGAAQWAAERSAAQRTAELAAMAAEVGRVQARAAAAARELELQRTREAAVAAAEAASKAAAASAQATAEQRAALDVACASFELLEHGVTLRGFEAHGGVAHKTTTRGACCQRCLDEAAVSCRAFVYDAKRYNCFLFEAPHPSGAKYEQLRKKGVQAGLRREKLTGT